MDLFTRREALSAAVLSAAATALPPRAQPADRQLVARGVVYDVSSGAARTGIPNVLVSNGRDVVGTGADGSWSLPVQDADSLFVIKPTGWMTPLEPQTFLPHFTHIHQPNGTPATLQLRFAGVAPTGPLPARIDFPLTRQPEAARFDVLLFTDPQPESQTELGFVRDDVVRLASLHAGAPVAFGITTGDIMFDDLSMYERHNRIIGTLGLPWYNLPGNHDMNLDAPDDLASRETFRRVYGARHYAWQYGGATFIALDNVEYLGNKIYRGHVGPAQLGFVRNLLAHISAEALVVLCMHIPLHTLMSDDPHNVTIDAAELVALLAGRAHTISVSGHTHTNEHHYIGPSMHHHHVLSAVSGSWWSGPSDVRGIPSAIASDGAPNGFHILSVDANRAQIRLVAAHEPDDTAMRIMLERGMHDGAPEMLLQHRPGEALGGTIAAAQAASATVLVNLFDGGPRSVASLRISGAALPMQRVERTDPFVVELYARNAATRKPWVQTTWSSHLWQARLPALPAGIHRIEVEARDEWGVVHRGAMMVELAG